MVESLERATRARRWAVVAGLLLAAVVIVAPWAAAPASATNQGTTSGNRTSDCAADWYAETHMDLDGVPGYDLNLEGEPVDYSNGGFIQEVSPSFNDPGLMEIQHWIAGNTMFWRIPVASDAAISSGTLTVTLPAGYTYSAGNTGYDYVMDSRTPAEWKTRWATTLNFSSPTVTGNVVTVPVSMPAGSHYVGVQITATAPPDTDMHQTFVATAELSGILTEGHGCEPTEPPLPPVPEEQVCQQVLTGRTLRPLDAPDITSREKHGNGGETNADGWGSGANTYFRLYGASDNDTHNAVYTATAAQGFTFAGASAVVTGQATGMGALYANGYTVAVTGVGTPQISPDGKIVTLEIAQMPAGSAFAFSIRAVPDDTRKQMVIDHLLVADLVDCAQPEPTTTQKTTSSPDCGTGTVTVTTTTTTTPKVWDAETGTFVDGTVTSSDTVQTRAMTDAEKSECPTPLPLTPEPETPAAGSGKTELAATGGALAPSLIGVVAALGLAGAGAGALGWRRRWQR